MLDVSLGGSGNGGLVLGEALAGGIERIGADDQQAVDAGESLLQAGRVIEIGLAGENASFSGLRVAATILPGATL